MFIGTLALLCLLTFSLPGYYDQGTVVYAHEWEPPVVGPWGLGLTIPDGSPQGNGDVVDWSSTSNLTVIVTLPRINYTDGIIYVIASIMTQSGNILQVAAGLSPGEENWSTYFMYATNISSQGKTYVPVLLKGGPSLAPGDTVSISIFSTRIGLEPRWMGRVCDLASGECREISLLADGSSTFMPGEQEVIALESYTSTEEVFSDMSSMVLHSVLADGEKVVGGWYIDDGLVFTRRPLFEVGGAFPVPNFIYMSFPSESSAVWAYSAPSWEAGSNVDDTSIFGIAITLLAVLIAIVAASALKMKRHYS